jgi:proline dehydrogenase
METSSVAGKVTHRFVAGDTLEDGLAVCRKMVAEKILVTLDYLGENVHSLDEAEASRETYLQSIEGIAAQGGPEGSRSTVSLKLTQFGLDFSSDACCGNVLPLVERAREIGSRVEVDMESSEYTDRTLDLVCSLARSGPVRAVIQAYLYRSADDIARLCDAKIPVRLCKGAYKEPPSVAFPKKAEVDENYVRLMKQLLDDGAYPAIASHDEAIIREALRYVKQKGYAPDRFEFQMLYGIRRDLQRQLVGQGYRVRLYVPYGVAWYPYFMRRLAERPANVVFLARNLIRS